MKTKKLYNYVKIEAKLNKFKSKLLWQTLRPIVYIKLIIGTGLKTAINIRFKHGPGILDEEA